MEHNIKEDLKEYIRGHAIINTHSHHCEDSCFEDFDLNKLIGNTYLQWVGVEPGNTRDSRDEFLKEMKYKSYFVWLQKAIRQLYEIEEEITADSWDMISHKIKIAHRDPDFHIKVLTQTCNYKKILVETYWNPGSDNKRPELFSPAFRIDSFLYGYTKGKHDFDGINPEAMYGELPDNMTDYLNWVKSWILRKKEQGCIALKSAIAYDRNLNFEEVSKEKAEKIFLLKDSEKTKADVANFQNYLFRRICEMSAEFSLPLQCHTGTGQLTGTRPIELNDLIKKNPDTKFVLLHCGYPWIDDIIGMVHEYRNVYADLCWMPILSYTASMRSLHELIEAAASDKLCWGCDTWTSEESYGALLAFQFVITEVLAQKIKDGYFTLSDAKTLIDHILVDNAVKLYNL